LGARLPSPLTQASPDEPPRLSSMIARADERVEMIHAVGPRSTRSVCMRKGSAGRCAPSFRSVAASAPEAGRIARVDARGLVGALVRQPQFEGPDGSPQLQQPERRRIGMSVQL
jgi:hypothetical protein